MYQNNNLTEMHHVQGSSSSMCLTKEILHNIVSNMELAYHLFHLPALYNTHLNNNIIHDS